jgi:hypothetical protein
METRKIYFIDVVYYKCYTFYKRYEKDLNQFSGQVLTSLCISSNIVFIYIILNEIYKIRLLENKWHTLLLSMPMLLLMVYRYNKHIKIDEIERALDKKPRERVKKLIFLAEIYIIFSIFGFLLLAIILGEINNPPPFWESWFK